MLFPAKTIVFNLVVDDTKFGIGKEEFDFCLKLAFSQTQIRSSSRQYTLVCIMCAGEINTMQFYAI